MQTYAFFGKIKKSKYTNKLIQAETSKHQFENNLMNFT